MEFLLNLMNLILVPLRLIVCFLGLVFVGAFVALGLYWIYAISRNIFNKIDKKIRK